MGADEADEAVDANDAAGSDPSADAGAHAPVDPSAEVPPARPRRSPARQVIGGVLTLALIVAIFVFLVPQLTTASMSEALDEITPASLVICLGLGLVHLACNWSAIVVSLRGLGYPKAGVANLSGAAVSNSLPEGGAFGTALTYDIFYSWGFGIDSVTASLVATGAWGQLVRYGLLAGGLMVVAVEQGSGREIADALGIAVAVGLALLLFFRIVDSEGFTTRIGHAADRVATAGLRLVRRGPSHATRWLLSLRSKLAGVAHRRGRSLTLATLAGELSEVLVLAAALRLMDIGRSEVSLSLVVVAYASAKMAALVVPTPGGVGVAESALLAVLGASVPTAQDAALSAAIVLYRLATWLLPTLLGIPAYLWWRYRTSWRAPAGSVQVTA